MTALAERRQIPDDFAGANRYLDAQGWTDGLPVIPPTEPLVAEMLRHGKRPPDEVLGRMEPLQLGVVAALTPPDVECALYDDRMEPIPYDEPTDLAAITVEVYTARRSYEIAAEYRRRGVRVIMGGFHPTLAPEECLEHADERRRHAG